MDVASGDSLVKIADEKVSAVHGGDPKDYGVMEMLPLFQSVKEFLDTQYPGNHFITATFDHSFAMAFWSLDGQSNELLNTYKQELVAKGLTNIETMRPGLRVMTSDVGMSGANLYPIFLMGCANRIIPLGYPIKTEHKSGKGLEYFEEQMQLLYARFNEAIEKQTKLMGHRDPLPAGSDARRSEANWRSQEGQLRGCRSVRGPEWGSTLHGL